MNKDERIKQEEERLLSIFADLDENELQVAEGIIRQASFMLITLEDLQTSIINNGSVGEYKNGRHQYGTKQSAELQAYNQTLRSYNAVVSKLLKIVPRKPIQRESVFEKYERIRQEKEKEHQAFLSRIAEDNDSEGGEEQE